MKHCTNQNSSSHIFNRGGTSFSSPPQPKQFQATAELVNGDGKTMAPAQKHSHLFVGVATFEVLPNENLLTSSAESTLVK